MSFCEQLLSLLLAGANRSETLASEVSASYLTQDIIDALVKRIRHSVTKC